MRFEKIRRVALAAGEVFRGRPWIGAVAFLALHAVSIAAFGVLLANMCESRFRFMPEFPDRVVVVLYEVGVVVWLVTIAFGAILLLLPIIPLCRRRFGVAYAMFVYNLGVVFVGVVLFLPEWFLGLVVTEPYEVARENLSCADPNQRKPLPRLRQRSWDFCNGRYNLSKRGEDSDCYWLCDYRVRYLSEEHRWEDRVLLEDVVQWEEGDRRLYLLLLDGEKHVLNFDSGFVYKYPDQDAYRQCKETDEIFARLEGRANWLEKYK